MLRQLPGGEVRAEGSGRTLTGTALRYGDVARSPFEERFLPGAFGDLGAADVILNVQHDRSRPLARTGGGGLTLTDSPEALTLRAVLPDTREANDTLQLVRAGVLRGLSIEFAARESVMDGATRVIRSAVLGGVGVVDKPAYPASGVEVRAEVRRRGNGLRGSFRYGETRTVSATGKVRKRKVRKGAFRASLADREREISLQVGSDPGKALASRLAGTLKLVDTDEALTFEVADLPKTSYVADLRGQLAAGLRVSVEPEFRLPPPEVVPGAVAYIPEPGNPEVEIEEVREAVLWGLSLRARPPAGSSPDVERRRRLWL